MKIMMKVTFFKNRTKNKSIPVDIDGVLQAMGYPNILRPVFISDLVYWIGRVHRHDLYEPNSREKHKAAQKLHQYLTLIGLI